MTTKYTEQEVVDFFHDIFNPTGKDLINVKAHDLMGQYLTQIEQVLDNQSITQKELASKIGISASYVSQFFNFNKLINLKTLAKIELALGISFELKPIDSVKTTEKFTISSVEFPVNNDELYAAA